MKNRAVKSLLLALACVLPTASLSASAFTGKEVMEVFSYSERSLYVAGLIDMAAYDQAVLGDTDRADCIVDWFYSDDQGASTLSRIEQAATNFPDEHLDRIVTALIRRACPAE